MNYPKVEFDSSETKLANYLCYLGKQISCGYYQDRRFLVLPKPINYGRSVYFPDLKYTPEFWNNFKNLTQNDYQFEFPKTVKLTSQWLSENSLLPVSQDQVLQHKIAWQAKEKQFFDFLKEFLPAYDLSKINKIDCLVTKIGTMGSFHFSPLPSGKYDFHISLREDLDIAQIAEAILSLFFHTENPLVTLTTWENRESIIDFLMTKTKFAAVFDHKYIPTVADLPEITENLVRESENYLSKLGFPIQSATSITNNLITINSVPITNSFTPSEKRIFTGLIERKNQLLTYDDVGNLFWGEENSLEKFSLQSIAKIMEKIRKKIKNHGIYQELIYTVRSQGYVLYD